MAVHHQSGSWSNKSILAGYGLSATIGPQEPTRADIKRLNSRSGGEHAGKGNWMQNYTPRPIIGSGRPKKMYEYSLGDLPVVQKRLPGLAKRKIFKYKTEKKTAGPKKDADGAQTKPVNITIGDFMNVDKSSTKSQKTVSLNGYEDMETDSSSMSSRYKSGNSTESSLVEQFTRMRGVGPRRMYHTPTMITPYEARED
jgi:hypothetical protein